MGELDDYEAVFHSAPCGFLTTSTEGEILKANQTLLKLLGYEMGDLQGRKSFQDLLTIGGKLYYETHYKPLLIYQGSVKEINFDIIHKSGNRIPVLVNTVAAELSKGKTVFQSTVLDITQRKLYERELYLEKERAETLAAQLKNANLELSRFAQVISHDIKTPLKDVLGLASLLQSRFGDLSQEKKLEIIGTIKKSAGSLSTMVDNVLNYYLNTDTENLKTEPVNIRNLVEDVISIADSREKVDFKLEGDLPEIRTYRTVVHLILLNLIVNGIKYNESPNICIQIRGKETNDALWLEVVDNGIGIKDEDLDKVFNPMENLNAKDRFNKKGTGLGLSYVKIMAEKLGGEVSVKSKHGKGSVFSLKLKKFN